MMTRNYFSYALVLVGLLCMFGCDAPESTTANDETAGQTKAEDAQPAVADQAHQEAGKAEQEAGKAAESKTGNVAAKTSSSEAAESAEPAVGEGFEVAVADEALTFKAPASWVKKKPRSFMIESEIAVPKVAGESEEAKDGRLTIMRAGGSVQANIERWYGQYSQPDGGETKDVSKVKESKVGDYDVTFVDITGTLLDRPGGPMAGGQVVERENYRTLAAIVQAGDIGQCFIKLYGPRKTIDENEAAFKSFVESMTVNEEKQGL